MLRAAVIVLAALLPAAPATAATVSLKPLNDLTFRAAAGETNDVSVESARTAIVVRDAGATLTPQGRCRALDAHAVRCRILDDFLFAYFALGDGNDRISFPPDPADNAAATLVGGSGDDEITGIGELKGGGGDDRLTGTERDEDLDGGIGADVIRGLDGDDILVGGAEPFSGPTAPDVLDGGTGEDHVEYHARRAPLAIDLKAGTGGAVGENDMLIGIEDVSGGRGADTITGDDGANIIGGGGRDTIFGLGGDDVLGRGHRVVAGPGDDSVRGLSPRLSCGPGDDVVDNEQFVLPADATPVPDDCERWQVDTDVIAAAHPPVGRDAVVLRLRCNFSCQRGVYRYSIRRRGRLLARGGVPITRRGPVTARLRLTARGRRVLRQRRVVTIGLRSVAPARTRWRAAIGGSTRAARAGGLPHRRAAPDGSPASARRRACRCMSCQPSAWSPCCRFVPSNA